LARAGHGVFQFAPDHARVPVEEWPWMEALARRTGRTVSVNLNQPDQDPDVWRRVLGLLEGADAEGLPIVAQVAGRSIGILYCLHGSVHPLLFPPAYTEVADLQMPERLAALAEPARRHRLIHEIPDDGGFFRRVVLDKASRMWPVDGPDIDYEPSSDTSIATIAAARGVPAMEVLVDQLTGDDGNGMVYAPFFNYSYGDLSMTYEATLHPRTRLGLSDAGAHCGAICDGGTPTFMLTHWARDRHRGPTIPLEHIVHRQTQQTAELYGLGDRGVVAPGMRADLNLIDFDALGFGLPRMAFDLPAGGRRLVQRARGYHATFVAGVQTLDHDEPTGE
ncbi:MAG: amidohydrolase family protein, partial [Acidimicrobiales bacterium]|nr:amidohydrolase family protein [Acidimicrobiales bacterium]